MKAEPVPMARHGTAHRAAICHDECPKCGPIRERRRAMARAKVPSTRKTFTACKRGHEYTPETSYINANGYRVCRICSKLRQILAKRQAR